MSDLNGELKQLYLFIAKKLEPDTRLNQQEIRASYALSAFLSLLYVVEGSVAGALRNAGPELPRSVVFPNACCFSNHSNFFEPVLEELR